MCMKCVANGTMTIVGKAEDEEHSAFELISNRIACGEQAMRIDSIPDGEKSEKVAAYVQGAIDSLGANKALMSQWWEKVAKRLGRGSAAGMSYDEASRVVFATVGSPAAEPPAPKAKEEPIVDVRV